MEKAHHWFQIGKSAWYLSLASIRWKPEKLPESPCQHTLCSALCLYLPILPHCKKGSFKSSWEVKVELIQVKELWEGIAPIKTGMTTAWSTETVEILLHSLNFAAFPWGKKAGGRDVIGGWVNRFCGYGGEVVWCWYQGRGGGRETEVA